MSFVLSLAKVLPKSYYNNVQFVLGRSEYLDVEYILIL